ncbi:hypothetical protein ACFQU7_20275 [Pseudoroseomonas wenyumeiae]
MALPAAWEDEAAAALAALAPGQGSVSLPALAQGWIGRLVAQGRKLSLLDEAGAAALSGALHALVLERRGAPGAATWRNEPKAEPRFVLNLPAFLDDAGASTSRPMPVPWPPPCRRWISSRPARPWRCDSASRTSPGCWRRWACPMIPPPRAMPPPA